MKLKELPASLRRAWVLSRAHPERHCPASLPVIVSLTSIPSRLASLHLVIRSLLLQTRRPEKIVLWLHHDMRDSIPARLAQLRGECFEIRYGELTCPHRKLVHALEQFPDRVIVTCDDDLMYDATWLERLYRDHEHFPQDIIAHECREIRYGTDGTPRPYREWVTQAQPGVTSIWMMAIGYGGVLYPPRTLHRDVTRSDLYLALAPRADDLWFKAMAHLNGASTRRSREPGCKPVPILGSQKVSLKRLNVRKNGNPEQWQAICDHYGIGPVLTPDAPGR